MRLLILEDDPTLGAAYVARFEDESSYEIVLCPNGEHALRNHQEKPFDFAIVDYDLGGQLNGLEVIEQMMAYRPLAFLVCTGNSTKDLFEQFARLLPVSFFTKPVDLDTIYHQVELHRLRSQDPVLRLRDRNHYTFEQIFETANIGICLTDIEGRFVLANPTYCRTYGYDRDELIGQEFTIVLPDELKEPLRKMHYNFLMNKTDESGGRWMVRCKDGTIKPIFVTAARVILPTGERYKATTVTDISKSVEYERQLQSLIAEKELLLIELQHRVKNNFQSMASLVRLQAQTLQAGHPIPEVQTFVEQVERRLSAMAHTHELLSRYSMGGRINACELIQETAQQVVNSVIPNAEERVQINLSCDPIMLTDSAGVSLCLILNEALTNSLKYALPERDPLILTISLKNRPAENLLELTFADNGPGYDQALFNQRRRGSLGFSIMSSLAAKMRGRITFDGSPEGARIQLVFPEPERAVEEIKVL